MRWTVFILGVLLPFLPTPTPAQESASYQITDHAFNAGGDAVLVSTSYQLTFVSIGDGTGGTGLSGGSYSVDGSFIAAYPPPSEVHGLLFADAQTLIWDSERSAGDYNLYRDALSNLAGLGYGFCEQQNLIGTTATDNDPVPAEGGFFYLVTVDNRLGEEGTKGVDSSDSVRDGTVCP